MVLSYGLPCPIRWFHLTFLAVFSVPLSTIGPGGKVVLLFAVSVSSEYSDKCYGLEPVLSKTPYNP